MKKRLLAFLLVALVLIPFAACANDDTPDINLPDESTNSPETTAAPESTGPVPELPNVRYENTELVFLSRPADATHYKERWLDAEDITGDLINDAVWNRNTYIEEKYGVTIRTVESNKPADNLSSAAMSNDDLYDVMYESFRNTGPATLAGHLYNIADFGYVNYDNPWWDSNSVEGLSYNGKLYAVICDISLMTPVGQRGMVFNRDLVRNYNLEDPYQLVEDDNWTIDKMIELGTQVSDNLDGNPDNTDADRYGFLTDNSTGGSSFFLVAGCGVTFLAESEDGLVESFMNEKTISILEKFNFFATDKETCRDCYDVTPTGDRFVYVQQLFAEDHFLFTVGDAGMFESFNRMEMKSEYGIVPMPKYDEHQTEYYHYCDTYTTCLSIPSTNSTDDIERLSVLLEDMAYKSSELVLSAYVDNVISLRRARVPELGEMVKLMRSSICYDLSNLYETINYKEILSSAIKNGNPSSTFKSQSRLFARRCKQVTDKLDQLG
ncbi:MAG: hypothetical protein IJF49_02880 [Clostridia bacterium]|nr:hypothetical protein [Clostridia bacterium]